MTLTESMPNGLVTSKASRLDTSAVQAEVNEAKLAAWVKERYSNMKSERMKTEMKWYVNLAMYQGNQYVELVPRLSKLITPKAPPYRVRHISNRIKPIIRTEMSRLTSQKPSASVIPASADDEDMMAAHAAEQVWESVSSRNKLQMNYRNAVWWELITGNAFMKVWWDAYKIDYDSDLQGDICFGHVTPFHIYVPDLREVDIQQQPYVLNVYTKPVEWVKRFYGDKLQGRNIIPDTVNANDILSDAYLQLDSSAGKEPDSVLCQEMWIKNGGCEFLDGDYVVHVIGENVVDISPFYQHGKYPFTHFGHIPSGTFYRTSVIEDLIPLQREYNRTRSQLIENKNRMARLQLRAPIGSVDPAKITNEPGQIIMYRAGLPPPDPMPLQPVPNYVIEELNRTIQDMEDISGQHEVSRGGVPPGVTAATAISFLQERDDSLMSHTFADVEEGMEEIARQTLALVGQFWDTPHIIKVVGEDGFFDTMMLVGSNLKGNTDIRMEGGSSLPTSKAARQALIMDMMKMGFIDSRDGLKILDIGGVQKLQEQLRRDESQAQRENMRLKALQPDKIEQIRQEWAQSQMQELDQADILRQASTDPATGEPGPIRQPTEPFKTLDQDLMPLSEPPVIPVNNWDNHEVHIEVHNNYRKSQAFELLPDAVKAQFEIHVQGHVMAVQQAMMEAQMFMGAGGGEPMPGEEAPGEQPGPETMPENMGPDSMGPQEGPGGIPSG